jgi:hypothetical protein
MDQSTVTKTSHANGGGKNPGSAFVQRYGDLYRAARVMVGLGNTIKMVGIGLASVIFVFWFIVGLAATSQTQSSSPFGPGPGTPSAAGLVLFFVCLMIGVAFGALVGGLFFLLGVLIAAQGQLLMAHADSAVHTSPFLTHEQRAAAMSLTLVTRAPAVMQAHA